MGYVFKSAGMGHFQAIKQSLFILVGDFSLSFLLPFYTVMIKLSD